MVKRKELKDGEHRRTYIVPLKKAYHVPRKKRAKVAVRVLREFIARHLRNPETIIIHEKVNEEIWSRSIEKPPRRIKVDVEFTVEEGKVVEARVLPPGWEEEEE
ncbi:MAG: 50S ribosomal protein L31e [Thermoprotei archaeon]|nr:MAG: 50S ribosomal protein L31e [Thermoprotei archaeon]